MKIEVMNIRTPVSWMGNKTSILRILYAVFPLGYERYIEPFGGSGAVLLGKNKPDKFEVYNDVNHNLVNLFRCMRDRPIALIDEIGYFNLNSREEFNSIKEFFKDEKFNDRFIDDEIEKTRKIFDKPTADELIELMISKKLDYDLRRAAMYLKLLRYSYSSGGKSFACQPMNIRRLFGLIQDVSIRLDNTVIENQDFEVLIKHYDRDNSFFYCDPPYYTSEYVYQCGFTWDDHLRLREALRNAKGKWLVSYNDCQEIRDLYQGSSFADFTRVHSMKQRTNAGEQFPELLISNYDMCERFNSKPLQLSLFDYTNEEQMTIEKILKECIISCKTK